MVFTVLCLDGDHIALHGTGDLLTLFVVGSALVVGHGDGVVLIVHSLHAHVAAGHGEVGFECSRIVQMCIIADFPADELPVFAFGRNDRHVLAGLHFHIARPAVCRGVGICQFDEVELLGLCLNGDVEITHLEG